jgi:hypothetical protein
LHPPKFTLIAKVNEHQSGTQFFDGVRMRVMGDPDPYTKVPAAWATRSFFRGIKTELEDEGFDSWTKGIYCGKSVADVADKMTKINHEIDLAFPPSEYSKYILTLDGSSHDAH